MEKEKKSLLDWIKEHKTQLIVAGVSITAIIAIVLGIKNKDAIEEAWASLRKITDVTPMKIPERAVVVEPVAVREIIPVQEVIEVSTLPIRHIPHDVSEHLRNLPEGWKASAEKMESAIEHGYELLPGQTWVESYRTGGLAA